MGFFSNMYTKAVSYTHLVAAAVALLVVPAAWFWGVAMRPAGSAAPCLLYTSIQQEQLRGRYIVHGTGSFSIKIEPQFGVAKT